jgi:hypothetical protein
VILLFTDFGAADLYVPQVKAALLTEAPGAVILDLLHEVPAFDVAAGAHLLAALHGRFPPGSVFLAVVDPGVGGSRRAVAVEAHGRWFVGPDNGLLSVVAARAPASRVWRIVWRPADLSDSFHARDLVAPVAARIADGRLPAEWLQAETGLEVDFGAADAARIIHLDRYGNAMTGLRSANATRESVLESRSRKIRYARVFAEAEPGEPFWYANSLGLVEVALREGSAAAALGLRVGDPVGFAGLKEP